MGIFNLIQLYAFMAEVGSFGRAIEVHIILVLLEFNICIGRRRSANSMFTYGVESYCIVPGSQAWRGKDHIPRFVLDLSEWDSFAPTFSLGSSFLFLFFVFHRMH